MDVDMEPTPRQQAAAPLHGSPSDDIHEAINECLRLQVRINRLLVCLRSLELAESVGPHHERPMVEAAKAPVEFALHALTKREAEVLRCVAEGHSTKQVAGILGVSFKTAACHRYRVMQKLGVHDTATLVRYAILAGISIDAVRVRDE